MTDLNKQLTWEQRPPDFNDHILVYSSVDSEVGFDCTKVLDGIYRMRWEFCYISLTLSSGIHVTCPNITNNVADGTDCIDQ